MELLVALVPALGCAALMLVCFHMMRHTDMHDESPETRGIAALREEVASLRAELDQTGAVPAGDASATST